MLTASFRTQVVWPKADVIVGAGHEAWLDLVASVVWNPGGLAEG
jgi:hypothetical protein